MLDSGEPADGPLDSQAKSAVGYRAKASQVEIPAKVLLGELMLLNSLQQYLEVIFPLAATDDLAITLGSENIDPSSDPRIVGVTLHVERFHCLRVPVDHYWTREPG